MSRRRYVTETPQQVRDSMRKSADYQRLRIRPTKLCARCGKEYKNTHKFFFSNDRGRLTSTCKTCAATLGTGYRAEKMVRAKCPICDEVTNLVRDLKAPTKQHAVRLCRPCINTINTMLTSAERYRRMTAYVQWRAGSKDPEQLARGAYTPDETPPDDEDDELVTDPVGEPGSYAEVEARPPVVGHEVYDYEGE